MHERFEFEMPARADAVFDTFHYHRWRLRWDSLVHATHVLGGAPCRYVGAVTDNAGGRLRPLAMQAEFISFDRPRVAAAKMRGRAFPFARWAASMRHQTLDQGRSLMVSTDSFETSPRLLRWLLDDVIKLEFDWQTRKRFIRMQRFLAAHSAEVETWQQEAQP